MRRLVVGRLGRVALAACILPAPPPTSAQVACDGISPVENTALRSVVVVTDLPGDPVYVTAPAGDRARIFIVLQEGVVLIHRRGDPDDVFQTFLDIQDRVWSGNRETGLLGLAFDPDYDTSGLLYVNYSVTHGAGDCEPDCGTRVSRFSVSGNPDVADPGSELILMDFPQPQDNHNGGQVLFGDDGMLYVFTGDGGGSADDDNGHGRCGNGQNRQTLLGKMLRIDVRGIDPLGTAPDSTCLTGFTGSGYTVPTTNPFVDGAGGDCDEVFAYGLRNPWRNGLDSETGDLYIADVGQDCWEEINYVAAGNAAGKNFGWRQMESDQCFNHNNDSNCTAPAAPDCLPFCGDASLTQPVAKYALGGGACAITGGEVYRGCRMPAFHGAFFYGDFCAGFVRSFKIDGGAAVNPQDWTTQIDTTSTLIGDLTRKIVPPFPAFEVSGPGAAETFRLGPDEWTWEDLHYSTGHPVDFYRVYRGLPGAVFECVQSSATPSWLGGDAATPFPGGLAAYVVTAVFGSEETGSGAPPRNLTSPCPPPP